MFCLFHCNTWLLTRVAEINMNTTSASRGLRRALGSASRGVERLRARASEQEIVFVPEDQQEPQAGWDGDDAGRGNSNRVLSNQAPAGDQYRETAIEAAAVGTPTMTSGPTAAAAAIALAPAASGLPRQRRPRTKPVLTPQRHQAPQASQGPEEVQRQQEVSQEQRNFNGAWDRG